MTNRVPEQEILAKTGLTPSTLWRWRKKGIIPPLKGRGKNRTLSPSTAFLIEEIVRLRREAKFSLKRAVYEAERLMAARVDLVRNLSLEKILKKETIKLNGDTVSLIRFCEAFIVAHIRTFVPDLKDQAKILKQIRKGDLANLAWMMFVGGYNSCLFWDGETVQIAPDFMIAQYLSRNFTRATPYVVTTLFPVFKSLLELLERKMVVTLTTWPAPKIRQQHGRSILEIEFQVNRGMDFNLDVHSAEIISRESKELNNQ